MSGLAMLLTASDMDPAFEASLAHTMVGLVSLHELRQFNLDEQCLHGMVWVSIQEHNSNSTVCHVNHHGLVLFEIREGASIDCSSVIIIISRWLGLLDTGSNSSLEVLDSLCISCSDF